MADLHDQLLLFGADELKARLPKTQHHLVDIAQAAMLDDGSEISFLHRGFCHAGLPLRCVDDNTTPWIRTDGLFTLTVRGDEIGYDGLKTIKVGVPYGPKARLLTMFVSSEVQDPRRDTKNRWIELGRITEWLRSVGVSCSGGPRGSITATKEQLFRLSFAQFTMTMRATGFADGDQVWFDREPLFQGGTFAAQDFEVWGRQDYAKLSWPKALLLTQNSYDRLLKQAIPLSTARLRKISDNASAMDLFCWLAYRLPKIPAKDNVLVPWAALMQQFGQSGQYVSQFRKAFMPGLTAAMAAYPEAKVEITDEGLVLRHSDPALPRKTQVASSLPYLPGETGLAAAP